MSGNPGRALWLVGMGVQHLSVSPASLPRVKKAIRSVSIEQCRQIADRVMKLEAARDVDLYLLDRIADLVPEIIVT